MSRAKEVLIILSPRVALDTAINSVGNDRRNTMLARRLAPLAPRAPSCPSEAAIAAAADLAARRTEAAAEAVGSDDVASGVLPETSS